MLKMQELVTESNIKEKREVKASLFFSAYNPEIDTLRDVFTNRSSRIWGMLMQLMRTMFIWILGKSKAI